MCSQSQIELNEQMINAIQANYKEMEIKFNIYHEVIHLCFNSPSTDAEHYSVINIQNTLHFNSVSDIRERDKILLTYRAQESLPRSRQVQVAGGATVETDTVTIIDNNKQIDSLNSQISTLQISLDQIKTKLIAEKIIEEPTISEEENFKTPKK